MMDLENIVAVGPALAAGPSSRIGNKIVLKSANLTFNQIASTTDGFNFCRYIVFMLPETPSPISSLAITDILQTVDVDSPYKKNGKVKYRILYDRTVQTCLNNVLGYAKKWKYNLNKSKGWPKNGLTVTYKDGNAGNPIKNIVGLLAISDSGVVAHPQANVRCRLLFSP